MKVNQDENSFVTIRPKILYFGTPVALVSSMNPDGSSNLAPISSFWVLGWTMTLGLLDDTKALENLLQCPDCVVNLPSPAMWRQVETLAPLTGKNPVPEDKKEKFHFEQGKFQAASFTRIPSETVSAPRVKECPVHMEAVVRKIHKLAGGRAPSQVRWRISRGSGDSPSSCATGVRFKGELHRPEQVATARLQLPALLRAGRRTGFDFPRRDLASPSEIALVTSPRRMLTCAVASNLPHKATHTNLLPSHALKGFRP